MSEESPLLSDQKDAVRILTINKPPYNVMSFEFMDLLEAEVEAIAADESVRAVVLTGAGDKNFSAGMNLKELVMGAKDRGGPDGVFDQRLKVERAIETMGKPWVVTLYGNCLGGGLELPMACHFRLAAEEGAQIGLPEMDLGSVPAWGGSARLPRIVGHAHALDMILRGRKISGPEAYRMGLVTEVLPLADLKDRAIELAEELASMPRQAIKGMMDVIIGYETKSLDQSLAEERAAVKATMGTPDSREGMMAFMEKRKPVFNQKP